MQNNKEQELRNKVLELEKEIKKLKSRKKYGLVWEDKPEEVVELCKDKLPVLTEDESKEINTDSTKPVNILIEGDNYHALSVLNYTHTGKIDVIYIDPPYNTGNEGWVYNDKKVDGEDSFRHSKWISFIEKRIKLAKNLLSDNGIIYISIDDNEVAQLKLIMEESFNHINTLHWRRTEGQDNLTKNISTVAEYILVYGKKKREKYIFNKFSLSDRAIKEYRYEDVKGKFRRRTLVDKQRGRNEFNVKTPSGETIRGPFNISEDKFNLIPKEDIYWADGKMPYLKTYLTDDSGSYPNNWFDNSVGTNEDGTDELTKILGRNLFNNPKPTSLIQTLIKMAPKSNSVLDFFAGSGTTGQAILKLNQKDSLNRYFILCTNNENKICEEVCYPRLKKVIKGYKDIRNNSIIGLGGNLKYYRADENDFVEAKQTDKNKKKLVDKSTEMLCLKEDCFEVVKKGQNFKIFTNNHDKYLGIIYDDSGIEAYKKEVQKLGKKISTCVFSLDDSAREEEFEDIKKLVDLKPIPAVILNVYKRIFK